MLDTYSKILGLKNVTEEQEFRFNGGFSINVTSWSTSVLNKQSE